MAIIVQNRFPIDQTPQKAVGVAIPFNAPGVFFSTYLTRDAIKNNLINFFSTYRGERIFNPLFGSGLQNIIFQNINQLNDDIIRQIISDEMFRFFPYVNVEIINVNKVEDENTYNIKITYQVQNFGINDTINITI
jgi:phage baseplate assembly protein W